jgi:hypothetical protein
MTRPRQYLTKSLFKKACECPRKIAYALSPEFLSETGGQFLQSLAAEGQKVEAYSQLALFPQGIHVGGTSALDKLVEKTRSLVQSSKPGTAIFEGAICSGPFLIRADIIHKVSDHELHILEIKAKSWDSSKNREELLLGKRGGIKAAYLPYIRDVAFQKMIVMQAFPEYNVTAYLVLPDKNKVNNQVPSLNGRLQLVESSTTRIIGNDYDSIATTPHITLDEKSRELILQSGECLVTSVNVDDVVDMVLGSELVFPDSKGETFPKVVADWASALTSDNVLDSMASPPPIGNQCATCEYRSRTDNHNGHSSGFETCWEEASGLTAKELAQGTPIVDIWHGGSLVKKLLSAQKYVMTDLLPEDFDLIPHGKEMKSKKKVDKNARGMSRALKQWYQGNGVPSWSKNSAVVLDETFLNDEMDSWRFPLHFIDFETAMPALPFSVGRTPFDSVAFQFSHHVMHRDGSVEHASEFLSAVPGQCPNGAFLDALAACMDARDGTVFRWGAHENTILSALLQQEHCVKKTAILESLLSGGSRAMVDLMQVVTTGYYVAGSDASSSIKKLLLPTMRASERLEDIYGKPTYSSSNFTAMQWWQKDVDRGQLRDPYSLLGMENEEPAAASAVAQGGDAIMAYSTLQQSNLDPTVRANIESSLLRYCELDTLAMVMIVQALQGFLQDFS